MGGYYPRGLSYYEQDEDKHRQAYAPGQCFDHFIGGISFNHGHQSGTQAEQNKQQQGNNDDFKNIDVLAKYIYKRVIICKYTFIFY